MPLLIRDSGIKMLGTDQLPQSEVTFNRCPGRSDTDAIPALHNAFEAGCGTRSVSRLAVYHAFMNTFIAIDELITETPAIAQKIAVHLVVIPVYNPAQQAV